MRPVFDLYIAIANITFFFALAGAYLLRSALVGRRRHARTESDGGSVFLNKRTMEMVYWILDPVIDFLAALHITPNMVTLFSLVPAAGAGVRLVRAGVGARRHGDLLRHPRRPAGAQDPRVVGRGRGRRRGCRSLRRD